MAQVSMKALLETGVHFGHRTRKWNPKMSPYIFTERNGIHILDLHQTLQAVRDAQKLVTQTVAEGGTILFLGTKRQAQETIAREAMRSGMPYVNQRWLGGTLTNWRTIRQRIDYLKDLEARRERGEFDLLTKKEALTLEREIEKLNLRLGGIREMRNIPQLMFVVDVRREHTAVHEANILGIPIIAMVDTNCDPDQIDYVIPSNDDAIRAIKLVVSVMADAVEEGRAIRADDSDDDDELDEAYSFDYDADTEDEAFLGEATLKKLQDGSLSFEGDSDAKDDDSDDEADTEDDAVEDAVEDAAEEEAAEEEDADDAGDDDGDDGDEEEAADDDDDEDEDED